MFAPRPDDVAREMVRVTRPGGRIVMGNWIPGDPTLVAQILRISGTYTPPTPEGFANPMAWGHEEIVRERFTAAGVSPNNHDGHFRLAHDIAVGRGRSISVVDAWGQRVQRFKLQRQ